MNKYIFIMAAICTLYCLNTQRASAQKVYKNGEMYILDCGPDSGFPQEATSTETKYISGTPSNNGSPMTENTHTGKINSTVYRILEVAGSDLSATDWASAYTQCAVTKGTGWRLPTQREFTLITIFRDAFSALGASAFSKTQYWTGTESDATHSWMLDLNYGIYTHNYNDISIKTQSKSIRCVREVPLETTPTTRTPKKTNK